MKRNIILIVLVLIIAGGIFIYYDKSSSADTNIKADRGQLSEKSFTNDEYGVTMYPPKGWYAKKDDYFNAQIIFLDQAQSSISDFASPSAMITLTTYPNSNGEFSVEKYIEQRNKEMGSLIDSYKSINDNEEINEKVIALSHKFSMFKDAISKKEIITVDGVSGIAYNYGTYFGGSGFGRTIILVKGDKTFVIIAETRDENAWMLNKEKIIQSMMSLKFAK